MPKQAILPQDIVESTVQIIGTDPVVHPTISLRNVKGTSGAITVYPCVQEVTVDGYGNAVIPVTTVAGVLTVGGTVVWSPAPDFCASTSTVLTSEVAPSGRFLRQMARAFGTAFRLKDGYIITEWSRAVSKVLAEMRAVLQRGIDQAFPDTVSDLIDEWETALGLPVNKYSLLADRVQRLTAKWTSRRGGSLLDITETVRVFDVSGGAVNTSFSNTYTADDPRRKWFFAVFVSTATWSSETLKKAIAAAVDAQKPAYTDYVITTNTDFRTDDPNSLTDRDVLAR